MADGLKVIVQTHIDDSGQQIASLNNQIAEISSKLNKLDLKINIDNTVLQNISTDVSKITSQINQALQVDSSSMDKVSHTINTTIKGYEFLEKKVIDTTNAQKQQVRETSNFKQEVDEAGNAALILTKRTEETTDNIKKQRQETEKLIDAMAKGRESSQIKERERAQQEQLAQDKAINRTLEERYKLQEKLALFQEKMLSSGDHKGQIDILGDKYGNKIQGDILANLTKEVEALNVDMPDLDKNMKSITNRMNLMKQEASASGTVMGRMFENMYKFLRFYIAGNILVKSVNFLRGSIDVIKELDTSLVGLNRVANLTDSQLSDVTDRAFEMGQAIGRTGKEVIDATSDWVRAGFDIDEAFQLSEQSLMLTNVGDGIENVEQASSSLIAVLRGFKMEAGEVVHVVDSLNEVSNKFALDANDLSEMLKRVSGTLAQTGTSFEETIGLATGGFESLRSAEVVASGLNMITQRLKGMKEDGEAVEGLIPKIQAAFDKYTSGAVSVIDKQNGGLNSTYEILEQLSRIYPTLTDEAKAYINEAVAGNRQNKVLVAIMENWQNVEGAIESATDSMGGAAKENEIYLNSIEGKTKQLQSSIQMLWKNTIDSSVIKFFVDLGRVLVLLADNWFSRALLGATALSLGFAGIQKVMPLLQKGIKGTWIEMLKLAAVEKGLKIATIELTTAMLASPLFWVAATPLIIGGIIKLVDWLTVSIEEQAEKVNAINEEYKGLNDTLNGLDGELKTIQDRIEELQNQDSLSLIEKDELENLQLTNKELEARINLLKKEAEYKSEELGRETVTLYNKQFGKDSVSNEKISDYQTNASITGNNAILMSDQNDINAMIAAYKQFDKLKEDATDPRDFEHFNGVIKEIKENLTHTGIELMGMRDKLRALPEPTEKQKEILEDIGNTLNYIDDIVYTPEELFGNAWKQLSEDQQEALQNAVENGTATESLVREYDSLKGVLDVSSMSFDKLKEYIAQSTDALDENAEASGGTTAIYDTFAQSMEDFNSISRPTIQQIEDQVKALNDLKDAAKGSMDAKEYANFITAVDQAIERLTNTTRDAESEQKAFQDTMAASAKSFQDVTSKIQSLYKMQNDLTKADHDYAQTMEEVISKHPELIQYLGNREELTHRISEAIQAQEGIQKQAYLNMMYTDKEFAESVYNNNAGLRTALAEMYGSDLTSWKSLAQAKADVDNYLIRTLGSNWAKYYNTQAAALSSLLNSMNKSSRQNVDLNGKRVVSSALNSQIAEVRKMLSFAQQIAGIDNIALKGFSANVGKLNTSGIKPLKGGSGSGSGSGSKSDPAKEASDAIREFLDTLSNKTALIEFNQAMNNIDQSYYEATGNINKVNQLRVNEINLLKQLNSQLNSNKKSIESKMKTVKSGSDDYLVLQDSLFDVTQAMRQNEVAINSVNAALKEHDKLLRDKIIEAEQLVLKAVLATAKAQYDANKKRLQDEYDTNKKIIQNKIDTLNKEKALLREEYNARRQQKDEEKKLEDLRKLETRYNKISKDNSGMFEKEKLDLTKQIADLREEIYEDEVLKQIELREDAIDNQIDKYQQEQELLDANYQAAQEKLDTAYEKAQETHAEYWKEVERIMSGSQNSIINYLKNNLDEYKQAGKLQKEAYLEGWGELLKDAKDIQSGATKDSSTVKKEVGSSTGANTGTSSGSSSGTSSSTASTGKKFPGNLKVGSKGEDVKAIQKLVGVTADGIFGANTKAAVIAYQKKHGLAADGIVGTQTWAKMFGSSASSSSSSSSKPKVSAITSTLISGSKGESVKTLQKALNMQLGTKLKVDGIFGASTKNALMQFQKKYGLGADGILGSKSKAKFKALGYSEGGLVDYTGAAIVHGSKQRPEAFLNVRQTSIIGDLARALENIPQNMIAKTFGNLTSKQESVSFAPVVNVYPKSIDKDYTGRDLGRDIGKGLNDMLEKAQRKSGANVPVFGSR